MRAKSVASGCLALGAAALAFALFSGPSEESPEARAESVPSRDGILATSDAALLSQSESQSRLLSQGKGIAKGNPGPDRKWVEERWMDLQELSPELHSAEERIRLIVECETGFSDLCASIALMISDHSILPPEKVQEMIDATDHALVQSPDTSIQILQAALERQQDLEPSIRIALNKKLLFLNLRKSEQMGEVTANMERDIEAVSKQMYGEESYTFEPIEE